MFPVAAVASSFTTYGTVLLREGLSPVSSTGRETLFQSNSSFTWMPSVVRLCASEPSPPTAPKKY